MVILYLTKKGYILNIFRTILYNVILELDYILCPNLSPMCSLDSQKTQIGHISVRFLLWHVKFGHLKKFTPINQSPFNVIESDLSPI